MTALPQQRSLLIVAHFSRYPEALSWSQKELSARFGQVVIGSELFPFEETTFYNRTMGDNLQVQLLCFSELISPEQISLIKNFSNELEKKYKNQTHHLESRPINIDPGYITSSKLVLASTKDASHRIYLTKGIFAEPTLAYMNGHWKSFDWTYPNYRRTDYQAFLDKCRQIYLDKLAAV